MTRKPLALPLRPEPTTPMPPRLHLPLPPTIRARTMRQGASAALRYLFAMVMLLGPAVCVAADQPSGDKPAGQFEVTPLADWPSERHIAGVGTDGDWLLLLDDGGQVFAQQSRPDSPWKDAGQIDPPGPGARLLSTPAGVVLLRGDDAPSQLLTLDDTGQLTAEDLPILPTTDTRLTAAIGSVLYLLAYDDQGYHVKSLDLAGKTSAYQWQDQEALSLGAPKLKQPFLFVFGDTLYLFGVDPKGESQGYRVTTGGPPWERNWRPASAPPIPWGNEVAAAAYGEAHVFVVIGQDDEGGETGARHNAIYAYHTITDRWVRYETPEQITAGKALVAVRGGTPFVVTRGAALTLTPKGAPPRFRPLDYVVVSVYLMGMVGIGVWFSRREKSTKDFFRGGQRVPWWASGMSLFATLSSAISLMSMPRMGYATNWTYFAIGIGELMALPVALFFLVPLIRRLNIATSNEYLEMRFGLVARVMGSIIFIVMQLAGRMAPVMLLPSIALEAITGIHIIYFILVMGVITTVYTYLGGLEAVVWTDTIQGFVMVGTIVACLALVFFQLSTPGDEVIRSLLDEDKLHTFEHRWSLVYPTMWMFLVYSFTTILMRLGDQNFVQRVQCTPTLKQAKAAVATQLAVAIPLNLLLFMVGTALWLFYRDKPDLVDPTIKTDSIYPFFAAQQMPLGIAGLVVAALLAATMSTVSSSICSISDLCVSDFYKRFKPSATDHSSLILGRSLTAAVGVLGTGTAITLSLMSSMAVWDLSVLIINVISLGVAGLFLLGLLTTRVTEVGAIVGMAVAFVLVFVMRKYGWPFEIHFFLITFIGSVVTFVVGYAVSLVLPGHRKNLAGLTVHTLDQERPAQSVTATGFPHESTSPISSTSDDS